MKTLTIALLALTNSVQANDLGMFTLGVVTHTASYTIMRKGFKATEIESHVFALVIDVMVGMSCAYYDDSEYPTATKQNKAFASHMLGAGSTIAVMHAFSF